MKSKIPEPGDRKRPCCIECGFVAYMNPQVVAGAIPEQDGKIVLLRRGITPAYGLWTFPAGFVELNETVSEGAVRETLEETGIRIKTHEAVGHYSYANAGVLVVVFRASVLGGKPRTCHETLEISRFTADTIPWKELAFKSTREALEDWQKLK